MKERSVKILALAIIVVYGLSAFLLTLFGQSILWRFPLALFPLVVILLGVALLKQSGTVMAFTGFVIAFGLAVLEFGTPLDVALGASAVGFLKSFGISISVAATMLLIFLMKETGALQTVSRVIKQQVVGNEAQALYIGIGFGSFLSSLGVVTPALFPPLLVTMGFSPVSAIAIAILGYDPTTSFSLLSIPITLPAQASPQLIGVQISAITFAFKIALFLPLVSTGFAFAILWVLGGKPSMRKGAVPAVISGLALAFSCLGSVALDYFTGIEYVPLRIVGVIGGLCGMLSLYAYQKLRPPTMERQESSDYPPRREVLRSFSPWILLTLLAAVVSIPQVGAWLSDLLGGLEKAVVFADQTVDFDFLSQIYTWILAAVLLSLITLRPTGKQVRTALGVWAKRFAGPFLTFGIYFSTSYVMAYSAMTVIGGRLVRSAVFDTLNMNVILGSTLAAVFGAGYIFVAASLGLFGAVVGGSEASSNVLFMNIQKTAADNVGLSHSGFMTVYGSHAVAGGIASAVTPAKINNAVVTIDAGHETESMIMRKHLIIAVLLTIATGILTGLFINVGI